jgi:aldehyde dehydrogenase (NAD+)
VENHWDIVQHETFAPILYLIKYKTIEEAIALQNAVPQGLSSAIMTTNLREAERFLSVRFRLRHCQREHRHFRR